MSGSTYLDRDNAWQVRSQALGITNPALRANLLASVNTLGNAANCISTTQQSLEQANLLLNGSSIIHDENAMSLDALRIVRIQYANLFTATANGSIACAENSIINAFADTETNVFNSLNSASTSIRKTFKPVNKFIGSTLHNLTGVLQNPYGNGLVPGMEFLMNKVNPDFAKSHQATWLAQKMDELQHLPGAIYGSLQHLQSAMSGGQLFGPVQYVKDMYLGAIAIVRSIGKFITDLFQMLQKFVYDILDAILPLTEVLSFLNTVASIASTIGSITSAFSGLSQISNFTSQLVGVTGQLSSIISNPAGLAMRFLPPQVGVGLSILNNPQAFLATLPPPWSTIFCILNTISGSGYNYNLGYGVASALNNIKSGVLAGIMSAFQCQLQILGNLVVPTTPYSPPSYSNNYRGISVPGRPGYIFDQHGQIVKDPCAGAPKPVYSIAGDKSTARAPSTETENQTALNSLNGRDGYNIQPASLQPQNGITDSVIQQSANASMNGQFANSINDTFTSAAAFTDTGKVNLNNLTGIQPINGTAAVSPPAYANTPPNLYTNSSQEKALVQKDTNSSNLIIGTI